MAAPAHGDSRPASSARCGRAGCRCRLPARWLGRGTGGRLKPLPDQTDVIAQLIEELCKRGGNIQMVGPLFEPVKPRAQRIARLPTAGFELYLN